MAAKVDTRNTRQSRLEYIQWMLQEVDCPFLEEDDDSWKISMFEPCEARIRLLLWLLTKFESSFGEILAKQVPSVNNRIESRVQRMLFLCNLMGLCRSNDLEVIKGTSSKRRQIKFWENLLEHVLISEKLQFCRREERTSLGYGSDYLPRKQSISVGDRLESCCRFIDNLVRQEDLSDVFSSSLTLFPPDLDKAIRNDNDNGNYRSRAPENSAMQELVEKLSVDVASAQKEYDHIMKKYKLSQPSQHEVDGYCKKLSLAITMLNQLVVNFLHCYESELRHWCNRPKAKKSGVGPASRTTLQMMTRFRKLFKEIHVLEAAYDSIRNNLLRQIDKRELDPDIGHDALMNLRLSIDILRESDSRINESF